MTATEHRFHETWFVAAPPTEVAGVLDDLAGAVRVVA